MWTSTAWVSEARELVVDPAAERRLARARGTVDRQHAGAPAGGLAGQHQVDDVVDALDALVHGRSPFPRKVCHGTEVDGQVPRQNSGG